MLFLVFKTLLIYCQNMCTCNNDWSWTSSTLLRSCDQAQKVLKKTQSRNFQYPQSKVVSLRTEVSQ